MTYAIAVLVRCHNSGLYYCLHTKNFNTTDSVITIGGSFEYGISKTRIAAPVNIRRYCAAVPYTTQQRYYNEAARQECGSVRRLKLTECQIYLVGKQ